VPNLKKANTELDVGFLIYVSFNGGPEPLENKSNKILGLKREDRFSDHDRSGTKYLFGSFFVPASPQHFL